MPERDQVGVVEALGSQTTIKISREADRVALRVIQEALTNVIKHAGGAAVGVTLAVRDDRLHIEVRNGPGVPTRAVLQEGGRGLRGMTARVAAVGGHCRAGPDRDGWSVKATLPCDRNGDVWAEARQTCSSS